MIEIKIKYADGVERVKKIEKGDWVDLRAAEDVVMSKGDLVMISLGVCVEIPPGYEAHVLPRSSTAKNFGILLANSMGIIDNSYCGDSDWWQFTAYAIRDTVIKKNDRIAQFRLLKNQEAPEFIEVEHLGNPNRGGIGSTGIN